MKKGNMTLNTIVRRAFFVITLLLAVGSSLAQGIVGSLVAGHDIIKKTFYVPEGGTIDMTHDLQAFYTDLDLAADQNVFVWLYTSSDGIGTFAENQDNVSFAGAGLTNWKDWGKYGHVYSGNAFSTDYLKLSAKINKSGYGVTMLVTKEPKSDIEGTWKVDQKSYRYFQFGEPSNHGSFVVMKYGSEIEYEQDATWGLGEKAKAILDDVVTFTSTNLLEGTYSHNTGTDGKIFLDAADNVSGGCTAISWAITEPTSTDADFYLTLGEEATFIAGRAVGSTKKYKIEYFSDSRMVLSWQDNDRYWDINLIKDGSTDFDYNSNSNLLKGTDATLQWDEQFAYSDLEIPLSDALHYDYSVKINLNQDAKVTLKLQNVVDDNSYLYEAGQVEMKAGDNVFAAYNLPGQNMDRVRMLFDFRNNGAGLVATISEPYLKASSLGERAFVLAGNTEWEGQYTYADYANIPKSDAIYVETGMVIADAGSGVSLQGSDAPVSEIVKGLDLKYMRWYLVDAAGDRVADQSPLTVSIDGENANKTLGDAIYENYGQYWHSASAKSFGKLNISLTSGAWDGYSIIGILSTDEGTFEGINNNKEPKWNSKVTIRLLDNNVVGNLTDVPVVHKTLIYNPNTRKITNPGLLGNYFEVIANIGSSRKDLADNGYARWFLAKKGEEKNSGSIIPMDRFDTEANTYTTLGQYGYAHFKFDMDRFKPQGAQDNYYDPVVMLPTSCDYRDVSLVCLVSAHTTGFTAPIAEDPAQLDIMYVYDLITEDDYSNRPFIHYHGESWNNATTDHEKEQRAYMEGSSSVMQYSWDYSTGEYAQVANDIRQPVHTVDYNVYLKLNDGETEMLKLPFQYFDGGGQNTEPAAYVRWYDWDTDMGTPCLVAVGDRLRAFENGGVDRGLFSFRCLNPSKWNVGADFKAPAGFSSRTTPINIACDVSRYDNGIDNEGTHLFHEPTLGVRYLFHIYPANVIANAIENAAEGNWDANHKPILTNSSGAQRAFKLFEDNGRVAVSLNGPTGIGSFSLRLSRPALDDYHIGPNAKTCTSYKWVVYYYDEANGKWYYKEMTMQKDLTDAFGRGKNFDRGISRIGTYSLEDFSNETDNKFKELDTDNEVAGFTASTGMTFHVVSMLSDDDLTYATPLTHYELSFIDAKPMTYAEVEATESRQEAKLRAKYPLGGETLTFDNFFCQDRTNPDVTEEYAQPTSPLDNYAKTPLDWEDAQYGFVYPQLYGQNATSKLLHSQEDWRSFGISPLHGDYTLLKSMNVAGVSPADLYDATDDEMTYHALWFNRNPLYDVTHTKDASKYGTFLYVDAADESRMIASLNFEATGLCEGTEVHYTAYVADMTNGGGDPGQPFMSTPPQVMFKLYAIDESANNQKKLVVSFLSGDVGTVVRGGTHDWNAKDGVNDTYRGQWYQLYGKVLIPGGIDIPVKRDAKGNALPTKYIVEVDNYAINTSGADYAVDEISFYCSAIQLKVEQESKYCVGEDLRAKFYVNAENLENTIGAGTKTIYYRICDDDNQPLTGVYAKTEINAGGNYVTTSLASDATYGWFQVKTADAAVPAVYVNKDDTDAGETGYYNDGTDINFRMAWRDYPFQAGKRYYMSLFTVGENPATSAEGEWGSYDNPCSTFSNYIIPKITYVSLTDEEGNPVEEKEADCSGWWKETLTASLKIPSGNTADNDFYTYDGMRYDFFIGTLTEFEATGLQTALDSYTQYREDNGLTGEGLDEGFKTFDEAKYNALKPYVENGKLWLVYSNRLEYEFVYEDTYHFTAIPVHKYLTIAGGTITSSRTFTAGDIEICKPIPLSVNYVTSNPILELGFDDVAYPTKEGYTRRVVRLGLEQIDNLRNNYLLHVPVSSFTAKSGNDKLAIRSDLRLFATNDPSFDTDDEQVLIEDQPVVATFVGTIIDANNKYISLNFHSDGVAKPTLHEGYDYTVIFQYQDSEDMSDCRMNMQFILRVVPEYVTWTKTADGDNVNWLNDGNWVRSSKAELYSSTYQDNVEIDARLTPTPASFVPMKFTYVTLPKNNCAPYLTVNPVGGSGDTGKVGILLSTASAEGSMASRFIEYDMLARYSETTCQGWPRGHAVVAGDIYDCEKFYGNVCNEIYFKPGAELMNQHYLTYNKAWVEKELETSKWYLMSTPLQDTYSGDMYVPAGNGQQQTEAFKDITFNDTDYSRTDYPIFQRSWGMNHESDVYVASSDAIRSDFTANLPFTAVSGVESVNAVWSHTFNDVNVNYNDLTSFSIRAHKQVKDKPAIIRLPKADTSYQYYTYDGNSGEPKSTGATATLTKTSANKFVTDAGADVSAKFDGAQQLDGYVLVGNPYMASIDMNKFFEVNGITERSYWTYDASEAEAHAGTGMVKPLQAFFIKAPAEMTNVRFTTELMVDGNHPLKDNGANDPGDDADPAAGGDLTGGDGDDGGESRPNGARRMTVRAANAQGDSKASVVLMAKASDEFVRGEDVETIFDSNLADVPMVYTVAGTQAVSIDVRPAFDVLPFGVVCTADDQPVSVTFPDADLFGQSLYVVDGATGEATAVGSSDSYEVQPNDYGRYYLTTRGTTDLRSVIPDAADGGIIVSVRGKEVTVRASSNLTQVRVLALDGTTVGSLTDCGTEETMILGSGIYIVEAQTADTSKTIKVIMR